MIVVDASVVTDALVVEGGRGDESRSRLAVDADQHAPSVIDIEVVSALRSWRARGRLDDRQAEQVLTDLSELAIVRYPHGTLIPRVWQLRHNLSAYDATYVALAEALGAVLVTADAKLARAPGPQCRIDLLA